MQARIFAFRERSIVWSLVLSVALFAARDARAAERRPQGSGFVVRGAAGIGVGAMDVSDQSGSQTGFAGGATLGLAGRRFELDFEIAAQPFRVDNPVGLESFRVVYFLPSLRIHGPHAYLRVGIGWARYSWSGPEAFVSNDSGPAVSAAVGYELARPRAIPVAIEAYFRRGTSDFEFESRLAGVQLVASWSARK